MQNRLRLRSCVVVRSGAVVPPDQQRCRRSGRQHQPSGNARGNARPTMPDRVPVLFPNGNKAYMASGPEARYLIRAGLAQASGSKQKIYAVWLHEGPSTPVAGTKYSVLEGKTWQFVPVTHHHPAHFQRVQAECQAAWKESLS